MRSQTVCTYVGRVIDNNYEGSVWVVLSCILRHWGVHLITYSWARPAILVAGKGKEGMFIFLLFLHFHSCSSFFPVPLFHLLYYLFYLFYPFSGRQHKMTHKGWRVIKPQHNQSTINQAFYCNMKSGFLSVFLSFFDCGLILSWKICSFTHRTRWILDRASTKLLKQEIQTSGPFLEFGLHENLWEEFYCCFFIRRISVWLSEQFASASTISVSNTKNLVY